MMAIPVGRLAPGDQWDHNMLDLLFADGLYPTGLQFKRVEGYPNTDGCCLIVPGRYWHQHTDQITEAIERYKWVLGFRVGDEEDQFDIKAVQHPNQRWWVQTPRTDRDYGSARLFGVGFPPHFNNLPSEPPLKDHSLFLAAQNTHDRRRQAFDALGDSTWDLIVPTEGFTQGLHSSAYVDSMVEARVAPSPSGAVSPDSFRAWEALEAHAIPILDTVSPVDGVTDYWAQVLPGAPIPVLRDYKHLPGIVEGLLDGWPANANRIAAYWMRQKRAYAGALRSDLEQLGAI